MCILSLEDKAKRLGRHLIKTESVFDMCKRHINIGDANTERQELMELGMKQVIQSRLYARNYFSVDVGYFVNIAECENLTYLNMIISGKDSIIEAKIKARNRIKELKAMDGQMKFVPDIDGTLRQKETKTKEEVVADLEADSV